MNINATILVQACNFFITYWMLRLFLFRPIIALIDQENNQKKALLDIIDQQQTSLTIQEKERLRHWYLCQEYFTAQKPSLISQQFFITDTIKTVPIIIHKLSDDDIARIVSDVRNNLEEKIKHVH